LQLSSDNLAGVFGPKGRSFLIVEGKPMKLEHKSKNRRGVEQVQAQWGWYFVIPAIIFFSIFSFYPIINAFTLSFFKKNMISPLPPRFIGLGNYMYVLQSPDFWNSVRATITWLFAKMCG